MAEEEKNVDQLILHQLRALDAKMDKGFADLKSEIAGVRGELQAFREDVATADAENAKILETITHDIADLKTIFVDVQARVVRNEKRVQKLEKRPEA